MIFFTGKYLIWLGFNLFLDNFIGIDFVIFQHGWGEL